MIQQMPTTNVKQQMSTTDAKKGPVSGCQQVPGTQGYQQRMPSTETISGCQQGAINMMPTIVYFH